MDIEIRYEKDMNRSAAYDGEKRIGLCEYEIEDGKWIITHTDAEGFHRQLNITRDDLLHLMALIIQSDV